jgi:hypothetical protein
VSYKRKYGKAKCCIFEEFKIEYRYVYICLVEGLLRVVRCVMSNGSSEFYFILNANKRKLDEVHICQHRLHNP